MAKFIDLTGQRFSNLLVIKRVDDHILPSGKPRTMWECLCDCGNITQVSSQALKQGTTISCGCVGKEKRREKALQRCEDISNKRYGKLLVLHKDESHKQPSGQTKAKFICQCDCGKIVSVFAASLKEGSTKSCGCERRRISSERETIDITGQTFGKLTVLERAESRHYPQHNMTIAYWKCKCECGSIVEVSSPHLRFGHTLSCGCLKSSGEETVSNILSSFNVEYKREYSFDDLRSDKKYPLRFDFAIFNNCNLIGLIEFQGLQHYEDIQFFGEQQRLYTDKIKKDYCKLHEIPLFEIRYDDDILESCIEILDTLHVNTVPSVA